jgi:hypothetical protein
MLTRRGIPWILLVACGVGASGAGIAGTWPGGARTALAALTIAFLLAGRRLLHELRDIARDQVAHPERPLPGGKVTPSRVWRAVLVLGGLSLLAVIAIGSLTLALVYLACVAFLWISLKDFYLGESLPESPGLRVAMHSLVALPLAALAIAAQAPEAVFTAKGLGFALLLYGSAVALSYSRSMEPKAHPAWPNVLATHGPLGAFVLILAAQAAAAWGARLAGAARVLGVFEWALVVLVALAIYRPGFKKFASWFAVVSLLAHAWAGPLILLFKFWAVSSR